MARDDEFDVEEWLDMRPAWGEEAEDDEDDEDDDSGGSWMEYQAELRREYQRDVYKGLRQAGYC